MGVAPQDILIFSPFLLYATQITRDTVSKKAGYSVVSLSSLKSEQHFWGLQESVCDGTQDCFF